MGRFRPLGFWLPASISVLGPKRSGSGAGEEVPSSVTRKSPSAALVSVTHTCPDTSRRRRRLASPCPGLRSRWLTRSSNGRCRLSFGLLSRLIWPMRSAVSARPLSLLPGEAAVPGLGVKRLSKLSLAGRPGVVRSGFVSTWNRYSAGVDVEGKLSRGCRSHWMIWEYRSPTCKEGPGWGRVDEVIE
jgi:hypothetical protein